MKENELKIQKTKEEKLKEAYIQYQMLKQQLNALNSQKSLLEKNIELMNETIENMKEINSLQEGKEILSSIGNGVYVKAELKNNKNVIIEIGNDIMIEKSIPEAILLLEKKKEEASGIIEKIDRQIIAFENEISKIERKIVEISKEVEK
ncbi:MAG: prefoldin subunit alpha [Candidatus Aenigmatarchaeota archaeon]|nr:prefoldin subunit alpha [Candidatus Aenigmarchaeota archaeon]